MYEDTSSAGSTASRKGDQVELVSKFLAPLCARDEAARNVALAAARTTVESWLGGVGSPNNNHWDPDSQNLINGNLGCRSQPRDSEGFYSRSVGAATIFARKPSLDSVDCVDGKTNEPECNCTPSHRLREAEGRFSSSSDSERRLFASCEGLNEERGPRHHIRIKSGRQKLFDEDDELDADTRAYGKSPKFDDDFGNAELRSRRLRESNEDLLYGTSLDAERVVFNTLDGFLNEEAAADEKKPAGGSGQAKRSVSRSEDVSWKSGGGVLLDSPAEVVTPGDVGRMLNLGNALDGPRQAQANKYLSLVSLHLPVILRLSVNCPFQNVRIKCTEIMQMIKDRGLPVPEPSFDGPSAFVPVSEPSECKSAMSLTLKSKVNWLSVRVKILRIKSHRLHLGSAVSTLTKQNPHSPRMTRMLLQEPGWKLERKGSALLLRRDSGQRAKSQRVCFRCDVEVREYERDEDYYHGNESEAEIAASPLAMCASCLAALCVTVVLPWLLIGG